MQFSLDNYTNIIGKLNWPPSDPSQVPTLPIEEAIELGDEKTRELSQKIDDGSIFNLGYVELLASLVTSKNRPFEVTFPLCGTSLKSYALTEIRKPS
jgi:hypothetical protein